jgi:Fur family ferric uptake transcriptional regulator
MRKPEAVINLREKGLRTTPQREMILNVISKMKGHVTAKTILDEARKEYPHLNKSVVYRTLNLFAEIGLVDAVDTGKGYLEYERHNHPHHHHLTCKRCGKSIAIDEKIVSSFVEDIKEKYHFTPHLKQFAVLGICDSCETNRL